MGNGQRSARTPKREGTEKVALGACLGCRSVHRMQLAAVAVGIDVAIERSPLGS